MFDVMIFVLAVVAAVKTQESTVKSNATKPVQNEINMTFANITATVTQEMQIPMLITTLSPEQLMSKTKRRSHGLRRSGAKGRGKNRDTSSSSGVKASEAKGDKDGSNEKDVSIGLSSMSEIPETNEEAKETKKGGVKSSLERRGWRKWHRKCQACEDLKLKWRDPSIKWICGAYQRARRSFKSPCAMYFRNCQDGTMFVKIADHRCPDDAPGDPIPHGDHFFYEYNVKLSGDTSKSGVKDDDEEKSADRTIETFSISEDTVEVKKKVKKKPIAYRRRNAKKQDKKKT